MRKVSASCLSTTWLSQILSNSVRFLLISPDPARSRSTGPRGRKMSDQGIPILRLLRFLRLLRRRCIRSIGGGRRRGGTRPIGGGRLGGSGDHGVARALGDARRLAGEAAQIIKLGA